MTQYSTYTPQQAHDDTTALFDAYYGAKKADVQADSIPPNKRIENADAVIEQYVETNGKRPPAGVLSRLATYILLDTLTDSHPDKMTREEYPIMSYGQTGRHFERNTPNPDLTYEEEASRGRVKRSFTTDDGEVWVANGVILDKEVKALNDVDWRVFLREVLTEREARIVEMAYGEGASHAEIGDVLGVSRQRVGAIMTVVYDKLSEIIDE